MKIFINFNKDREITYNVCRSSILTRNPSATITPLNTEILKEEGIYDRENENEDVSRFFIPLIMEYEGWALYSNDKSIFIDNIARLFSFCDNNYAVMIPADRKSSLILWNCSHPNNKKLDPSRLQTITTESLQTFSWLKPEMIGVIHSEWACLGKKHEHQEYNEPKRIEYINEGPWVPEYKFVEYGAYWESEKNTYVQNSLSPRVPHKFENLPNEINSIIDKMIEYRMDQNNEYYKTTKQDLINEIETTLAPKRVFAVDSEFRYARKGNIYDPMLENFILGAGGQITTWDMIENDKTPVVIRGIAKRKQIHSCWETGRDFYYIDTGYFGNGKRKLYHRITKNHLQNIYPVVDRPRDRLSATGWRPCKFRGGRDILVCPPSAKVMKFFDLDLDQWMDQTLATIKQYTDRPIVIRLKQSRSTRMHDDTLAMALSRDVHCLVTFNSIAATEALLLGKPAFTLGPNAAGALSLSDLSQIEKPYIPSLDEVEQWAAHLAYSQFTELEMRNGYAWSILNETSNISSSNT